MLLVQLNKLVSIVYQYNIEAQKNIIALGFLQEGLLRKHHLDTNNKFVDIYYNGLLREEFYNNQKLRRIFKRLLKRDITSSSNTAAKLRFNTPKALQFKNFLQQIYNDHNT